MSITSETQFIGISSDENLEQKRSASVNVKSESFTAQDILGAALTGITFAELPSSPTEGLICAITDSTVATWGSTVTGGGANHALIYYNGSEWTLIGK